MGTILETMQWKQLQHDERYHKDICVLSVSQRARHMIFHLVKYSGQLLDAVRMGNEEQKLKCIVDAFIIVFSYANIFQYSISDLTVLASDSKFQWVVRDFGLMYLREKASQYGDEGITPMDLAIDLAILIGEMAKTAEAFDHLEIHDFRENYNGYVKKAFGILTAHCMLADYINIDERIANRLHQVEKKNPFFKRYGNYMDGYI